MTYTEKAQAVLDELERLEQEADIPRAIRCLSKIKHLDQPFMAIRRRGEEQEILDETKAEVDTLYTELGL